MYLRILVPVDGSAPSTAGLEEAIRIGASTGAVLRPLHMLDPAHHANGFETAEVYCDEVQPTMRRDGERLVAETRALIESRGVRAEPALVEVVAGRLVDLVIEEAGRWGADLVVIGSHGRRGLERLFMGSDAEAIVRTSPVPVLVVREGCAAQREGVGTAEAAGGEAAWLPGSTLPGLKPITASITK
jgi:nucleotide-binding universal stress UspA family protein